MLVSQSGDMFWAAYQVEPGEEPYWDRDLEYGGTACEPDLFLILPKRPPLSSEVRSTQSEAKPSAGNLATDAPISKPSAGVKP